MGQHFRRDVNPHHLSHKGRYGMRYNAGAGAYIQHPIAGSEIPSSTRCPQIPSIMHLGMLSVSGIRRMPRPAPIMIAFTRYSSLASFGFVLVNPASPRLSPSNGDLLLFRHRPSAPKPRAPSGPASGAPSIVTPPSLR